MFQKSESCIKLHEVAVLELLLSEQENVRVCLFTTVCVCVLGWVKCREHISLLVILRIIVYVTKKNKKKILVIVFFQNRYPIMVKCLNIGKNIGKPIYRSISNFKADTNRINMTTNPKCKQSANYCDLFIYLFIYYCKARMI